MASPRVATCLWVNTSAIFSGDVSISLDIFLSCDMSTTLLVSPSPEDFSSTLHKCITLATTFHTAACSSSLNPMDYNTGTSTSLSAFLYLLSWLCRLLWIVFHHRWWHNLPLHHPSNNDISSCHSLAPVWIIEMDHLQLIPKTYSNKSLCNKPLQQKSITLPIKLRGIIIFLNITLHGDSM